MAIHSMRTTGLTAALLCALVLAPSSSCSTSVAEWPASDGDSDVNAARQSHHSQQQQPDPHPPTHVKRRLHGRFLHITDMHPDPHYLPGASVSSHCHRKAPKKEEERAGYFGVPFSECDSPLSLTNLTLDYLEKKWAHNIDFVIWTGDNARHDNDNALPRTPGQIYELNRIAAKRMEEIFRGIPIVPSIGNNDIWPHNIMTPGPNSITNEFSAIWRPFIPFSSYQVFQRGGYYSVELVPGQLAAISLNTMYWYDANKAVEGCPWHDNTDPGNLEFDWLEVQLDIFRQRGMQVILSGHVPPGPGLYFPDCFFRYGQIALRFQDTIISHFYGHMNNDHFFWLDVEDLMEEPRPLRFAPVQSRRDRRRYANARARDGAAAAGPPLVLAREALHQALRRDFRYLSETKHVHHDDYTVVNVGPSVLPEYFPSFRIYQYNTTGYVPPHGFSPEEEQEKDEDVEDVEDTDEEEEEDAEPLRRDDDKDKKKKKKKKKKGSKRKHGHRHPKKPDCSLKENEEKWACRPWGPRYASVDSPSRSNRLWSLLGYAQYYLPDIGTSNKTHPPKFKLEYLTFPLEKLHRPNVTDPSPPSTTTTPDAHFARGATNVNDEWVAPIPKNLLPRSLRNVTRTRSKFAPYRMPDLTIPSWIKLARRMDRKEKLWNKFVKYMYMGEKQDDFGFDSDLDLGEGEGEDVDRQVEEQDTEEIEKEKEDGDDYDDDDDEDDDDWEDEEEPILFGQAQQQSALGAQDAH